MSTSTSSTASSGGVIEEESSIIDHHHYQQQDSLGLEKVYVAVVKEFKEGRSLLLWTLQNMPRDQYKLIIVHVHRPSQTIPIMGGRFPVSQLTPQQVKAYHQLELGKVNKSLDDYLSVCLKLKFQAEKLVIEAEDISKGLVELITQHGINKLVMGAAADRHYAKKMNVLKSKTANVVSELADKSCKIWFVCKGNLIFTRDAGLDVMQISRTISSSSFSNESQQARSKLSPQGRSQSFNWMTNPMQSLFKQRSKSEAQDSQELAKTRPALPSIILNSNELKDPWDEVSGGHPSLEKLSYYNCKALSDSGSLRVPTDDESDAASLALHSEYGAIDDELFEKWQNAVTDAENSRHEAYEETCMRRKAEKDAVRAQQKAKASDASYRKEMEKKKENEEALERERRELESLEEQLNEVFAELQNTQKQKATIELQIAESEFIVKDLNEKLSAARCLLSSLRREHEELQQDHNDTIKEAEEMHQWNNKVASSNDAALNFSEFSYSEIQLATNNFDDSLKIGEGGYGSVYKGFLRHTTVAIKMLNPQGKQGLSEFQQEVNVLSRLRHPNLVTLIGTCSEAGVLVYEFLPGGSLEDRLMRKDNTPPLPWQLRTQIAAEICAALIFLHSSKPYSVVHGDMKPANILLDANFVSKVADFGICRLLCLSNNSTTLYRHTHPKGTFVYMDPEFLSTGELTPFSDVYSFGVIILRLLTGRPALGLIKQVQDAIQKGCLHEIIDPSAGDWPFIQAKQLAQLGLKCCEIKRKRRPELAGEVWKVFERLKKTTSFSGSASMSFRSILEDTIPSYFICPILQEVMREPYTAADGFTYEVEAIRGWIDSGYDTSPLTNLKLPHHELIPNLALRSAIQEWLDQQK